LYLFVVSSYSAFLLSGCFIKFSSVHFSSVQFSLQLLQVTSQPWLQPHRTSEWAVS